MAASLTTCPTTARPTTHRPRARGLQRVRAVWGQPAGAGQRRVAAAAAGGGDGGSAGSGGGGGEDDQPPTVLGDWRQFRAKLVADSGAQWAG